MQLSVIIPVYNVAPYLRKCVDSVLEQDYQDVEIILVDDGSTDNSPQICDEYMHSYPNVRVIHKKNGGQSAARNTGIEVANGEYISFLDSDDYWQPNVLGELMKQIEHEQLDVLRFDYQNVRINNDGQYEVFQPDKYPHPVDLKKDILTGEQYLNKRMDYSGFVAMFIMRQNIVPTFVEGIHYEDAEWQPRMMMKAQRVNSTPVIVYNYLIREGSTSHSQKIDLNTRRKNIENQLFVIQQYNIYMKQNMSCYWLRNMQSRLAMSVIINVANYFYQERIEYIERLRTLNVFPLSIANQGKTYIRKARLINISVYFTMFLLFVKKQISKVC